MALADGDIELEDGEINDLEDGEIDEEILLPTESNNVFSRLEPRQDDSLREQHVLQENLNSYGENNRDFVIYNSGPSPGRWEPQGGSLTPSRERFPRGRTGPVIARDRGKMFRGNGREMMGRGKHFPAKRENPRRSFLQRPNLPHSPSVERPRAPYNNKRVPAYPDNERPRLPYSSPENRPRPPHLDERRHAYNNYFDTNRHRLLHPLPSERQIERLPLKELDEKSWPAHNEVADSTPTVPVEPGIVPSPLDEEEVDDYRILLQRHRLIQQQLAALEKQENSTLVHVAEDSIIDDTFIDIPVEDTTPNLSLVNERKGLEIFSDSLEQPPGKEDVLNSQQSSIDTGRNITHVETSNNIYNLEKNNELFDSEQSEDSTQKSFLPFRIKPRYGNVPSIKELSQKDLELREAKQCDITAAESNNAENLPVKEANQAPSQRNRTRGRGRKNRKKKKRIFVAQGRNQSSTAINSQATGIVRSNQGSHVDPYNELEARLMSLAGSSVSNLEGTDANREDVDKQRERRERLRQWQEKMNKEGFSDPKNQQGNKLPKKKLSKPVKGDKRRSSAQSLKSNESQRGDRVLHRRNVSKFENDDYFEIPMDVESDSTDGPALPLIEEPVEDFPPPPPPLPNGDSAAPMYVDQGQHALMMYPPAGYFQMEQNYSDWLLGSVPLISAGHDEQQFIYGDFARHPAEGEGDQEWKQFHTQDMSSQDNSDEDDEATLREQLLKSLAVKRKAKLVVRKETKSSTAGSASASPRVQSPTTVPNNEQQKKQQQNFRQVSFVAPPKHDPVVIKLGEDTDSEESDASDTESAKKVMANRKGTSGGLFGGLEMMIKEARKSAEASKVKESQNAAPPPQTDTGKPVNTDLPTVPTTPDAMDHMPEQMKTEYRRLKEKLAQREKTRQPLANVNLDKEDSSQSVASEDQAENTMEDDSRHLRELHSFVTGCEENLSKHKKFIQKDRATLTKMVSELNNKSHSLEAQEANVRKLQQQLETAQKIALANRMLMSKLRNQAKVVKERVCKKQSAASNFEEELLRAKSILSAVKRKMPAIGDTGSGRNSPQLESLSNVGNENQKFMITSVNAQEIKSSLAAKLNKLSSLSKLENKVKRKLEGTSDSSEETVAKKAKPATLPPERSPASSTPSTPRKSAMSERIAQEKARLKKLEHELSEKLKLYGRQKEKSKKHPSVSLSKQSQNNGYDSTEVERIDGEEIQPLRQSEGSGNSNHSVSEKQELNSRRQHLQLPRRQNEELLSKDTENPEDMKVSITAEQLERIRKLQAEKEKNGPSFSGLSLDVPVAAHQRSTLCVLLPFGDELTSMVTDEDTGSVCREEQGGSETVVTVAGEFSRKDGDDVISCPLEKYQSQLLHFKSYRLSPYFRIEGGFPLTSITFSNKLNPVWPLCNFDLQGKCNDEDCKFQHFIQCKLSQEQTLQDLAAYNPSLTADDKEFKELQENVESFTKAFAKQYQDKMSWEELCILLVNDVRKSRKSNGPFSISLQPRSWMLKPRDIKQDKFTEDNVDDLGRGIVFARKDKIHGVVTPTRETAGNKAKHTSEESQEIRYFVEVYSNIETLEASLDNSPGDVALWIKLARLQLYQNNGDVNTENGDKYRNNVTQALSTLSRALEENTQSEELWLEYLELYSSQSTQDELREICDQAVEFSPTYSVWWQYLEYSRSYHAKKTVCLRLISFLAANPVDPKELHSQCILETLLYLVQLELYSGHYKSALAVFQAAIAKKHRNSTEVPDLSVHMLPSDCCLAWLAYIHVFEFHHLPTPWFDPRHGKPSRMVTKEDFVFPWKPSQQSRASGEKLLAMFQDALKACSTLVKSSSSRLAICLPLYKNLIALERAYGRISSARGICRHLLKDNPSVVLLWLCLAALEDAVEKDGDVEQVYKEALLKCEGHAELSYSAARYYLEQNEVQKAESVLIKCVLYKFASASNTPEGEVLSLAVTLSEHEGTDPVALYRRLLSQPLPYDYKCPPFMPGVAPQSLGKEEVFLWLSYCLLLEISPPSPTVWDNLTPESAFETAVHSPLDRQDIQTLWTEYLFYQRSKALQREKSSQSQNMNELVNRCLMSVSTSSSLPHSSSAVWQDYRFHNQVISISLSCQPQSSWSADFKKYLRFFPGSVSLALWACKHEVEKKNFDQAKRISASFLSENPHCISMWKVAISIELQRHCIKEFLMFELAQSGDGPAVQEIVAKSREIGVDLEEFLNTLFGGGLNSSRSTELIKSLQEIACAHKVCGYKAKMLQFMNSDPARCSPVQERGKQEHSKHSTQPPGSKSYPGGSCKDLLNLCGRVPEVEADVGAGSHDTSAWFSEGAVVIFVSRTNEPAVP